MNNITENEFVLIRDFIKKNYGINLSSDKKTLVYSRLRPVLAELGIKNFKDYYEYLISDKTGQANMVFIDKMTTNHTYFMREVEHFYYFRDVVLPHLERTVPDKDIRIWCAGCSSGEESYTLQMFLTDYFGNKQGWNIDLLATDISTTVLEKACAGVYSKEQIKPLSDYWKQYYFKNYDEENVVVTDTIKNKIVYRKFNLMSNEFPFKKKFDVIFCRNVMIYFDAQTRDNLVQKFYDITVDGGYLFIGHSEAINCEKIPYKYIKPAIYRK